MLIVMLVITTGVGLTRVLLSRTYASSIDCQNFHSGVHAMGSRGRGLWSTSSARLVGVKLGRNWPRGTIFPTLAGCRAITIMVFVAPVSAHRESANTRPGHVVVFEVVIKTVSPRR